MTGRLQVTRHATVEEISGFADLAAAPRLYESRPWLRYCELTSGGRMTYLVARDDQGSPVGLTASRVVRPGEVMALYDLGSIFDGWRPADLYPNVVAAVSGSHYVDLVRPGRDSEAARTTLATALASTAAEQGCRAAGALYVDNLDTAARLGRALGGSPPFAIAAQTVLTGDWPDFEGYLASLKRSRRNKVRRERRDCLASGVRISACHGTAHLDERTAELQLALRRKYAVGGSVDSIMADYDNLRRTVDDRVLVFRAELDGELVGMSLALLDGECLHVRLVGFDYARSMDFLYFNVLFYAPIEWGTRHGIAAYRFGTSSYPAKLARGCTPELLYATVLWPDAERAECEKRSREHEDSLRAQLFPGQTEETS
jgi:uncharacterized protein